MIQPLTVVRLQVCDITAVVTFIDRGPEKFSFLIKNLSERFHRTLIGLSLFTALAGETLAQAQILPSWMRHAGVASALQHAWSTLHHAIFARFFGRIHGRIRTLERIGHIFAIGAGGHTRTKGDEQLLVVVHEDPFGQFLLQASHH